MSFAGFKFATTMIVFPMTYSGVYLFSIPAMISRCSEPRSTWSLSNLFDFVTRSAVRTLATNIGRENLNRLLG